MMTSESEDDSNLSIDDENFDPNLLPPAKKRRVSDSIINIDEKEKEFRSSKSSFKKRPKKYLKWRRCPGICACDDASTIESFNSTIEHIIEYTYDDERKNNDFRQLFFAKLKFTNAAYKMCDSEMFIHPDCDLCSKCKTLTENSTFQAIYSIFRSALFDSICQYKKQYPDIQIHFNYHQQEFIISNLIRQTPDHFTPIVTARLSSTQFIIHSPNRPNYLVYSPRNPNNIKCKAIIDKVHKYFAKNVVYCIGFKPPPNIHKTTHSNVFPSAQFLPNGHVTNHACDIIANKDVSNRLCKHCYRLRDTFHRHRQNGDSPNSKFIPLCKLSTIEQAEKYRKILHKYTLTHRKYERIKSIFEKNDTIIIKNASDNEFLYGLLSFLSDNIDKLNEALIHKPLLLSFVQDQLQSCLQQNKV